MSMETTMKYKPYPAYKESGVEWLGEVPEHWKVTPIKHLGRLKGGAGFPHNEQGLQAEELSFHKVNALAQATSDGTLLNSKNTISRDTAKRLGAFIFPSGSIVFAKVGAALLLSRIRILGTAACLDNNMMGFVVDQSRCHVTFIRHAMNLVRFDLIANPGAVPSINEAQIGDFTLVVPNIDEQQTITAFLDRETAKIDTLIAKQERLIELLQEKRTALISHAVIKGLNPDAPMKDSGVEWLGEVPEHWEVIALKRIASLKSGETINSDSIEETGDFPVFGGNGLRGYTTSYTHEGIYALIGRQGALCGNINYATGKFWASEHAVVASPVHNVETYWLGELLRAMNLNQYSISAAQPGLSVEIVGNLRIPFPPSAEQQTIATFLDCETTKIDTLITKARRAIDLLKERRTALISAAVTGKIDVREVFPSVMPE